MTLQLMTSSRPSPTSALVAAAISDRSAATRSRLGRNPTKSAAAHLPPLIHQPQALCLRAARPRQALPACSQNITQPNQNQPDRTEPPARARNPPNEGKLEPGSDANPQTSNQGSAKSSRTVTEAPEPGAARLHGQERRQGVRERVREEEEEEEIWLVWRAAWRRSAAQHRDAATSV